MNVQELSLFSTRCKYKTRRNTRKSPFSCLCTFTAALYYMFFPLLLVNLGYVEITLSSDQLWSSVCDYFSCWQHLHTTRFIHFFTSVRTLKKFLIELKIECVGNRVQVHACILTFEEKCFVNTIWKEMFFSHLN